MEAEAAREKHYREIIDYLFVYAMATDCFDDLINEDPNLFETFRKALVDATKDPNFINEATLDYYFLGDVRYRRFFIFLQDNLIHILESLPIPITEPFVENFNHVSSYLLDKLSNMVADCHCFVGSKRRFVD